MTKTKCPDCGNDLTTEHIETLLKGLAMAQRLGPHVRYPTTRDLLCPDCLEKTDLLEQPGDLSFELSLRADS